MRLFTNYLRAGAAASLLTLAAGTTGADIAKVSLYQESRTTTSTDNKSKTVTRKVWIKQPGKFRMEEVSGPDTRIMVSNGSDYWIALPSKKQGLHRVLNEVDVKRMRTSLQVDIDAVPKFVKSGAKKTGQEKVNGILCDVYKYTNKEKLTFTLWVSATGQRLAQRQETSGVARAAEAMGQPMSTHILKSTTDYLKWQIDQPLADSLFTKPVGVTYQEFKPGVGVVPAPAKK